MFKSASILVVFACVLFSSIVNSWNVFPFFSNVSLQKYTADRISSLKTLRNAIHGSPVVSNQETTSTPDTSSDINLTDESLLPHITNNGTDEILQKLNKTDQQSSGGGITAKQPRDGLFDKFLPKRDILKSLVEIREKVEPEVKRYLTDKYNLLLNNLVPYSETIGVPPYVLNSMKIPQNFDPRFQALKTLIEFSIDRQNLNKSRATDNESKSTSLGMQSRSSDDQDLVSDQEPDATMKRPKKYQHVYISPRSRPRSPFMLPERSFDSDGFETSGSQRQELYDAYSKDYYLEDSPYAGLYDMQASAGSHVARGSHGHYGGGGGGYGGGHGGGYGGMTDPFTILGSLAFLTYLGLLIQQSLNRTGGAGRRFSGGHEWETLTDMRRIPVILTDLRFNQLSHKNNLPNSQSSHAVIPFGDEKSSNRSSRVDIPTVTSQGCNFLCQILLKTFNSKNVSVPKNKKIA